MDGTFLTIMIFGSAFVLIVAIVVLTIKYIRTNTKAVSREQFRKEAVRQASKMKYESPVITCDFCGYVIDTQNHQKCPNCGAPFSDDSEWTERYDLSEDSINSKADDFADLVAFEKTKQVEKIAGRIKKCLLALGIILGLIAIILIAGKLAEAKLRYVTENDELNSYSSDAYVPTPYGIDGDGVLIDENGVKVTVFGIYENQSPYRSERDFKIGFHVENESGQPVSLSAGLHGVNGKTRTSEFVFLYGSYKDHADIIKYEQIYGSNLGDPEICEMIYTDIWVRGEKDSQLNARVPFLMMKTTSTAACAAKCPEETVLYDDHQVVILCGKDEEGKHLLWIDNRSDVNYEVTTSDLRVNGNDISTWGGAYKDLLPAGYLLTECKIHSYDEELGAAENGQPEVSVSFSCKEDPSKSFSTGYLQLEP